MGKGSNLRFLGDFNQTVVLDAIRRAPDGLSRVELGRITGLTAQTMSNIARRLLDSGLIREAERVQQARGKPRTLLRIDPSSQYAVGVHLDPATLTLVLVDLAGEVQQSARRRTPEAAEPQHVISSIAGAVEDLIADSQVDRERVLGVGVAVPGPVDVAAGMLLDPPQLSSWHNVNLRAELHAATGLHVLMDKDVTAAAAAELWATPGDGRNFVFCYLGSGIGIGVVMNDEVLRGATNNIGEVGEILVDPNAEDLGFGVPGSLAQTCLPQALVIRGAAAGLIPRPDSLDDFGAVDQAFTLLCALAADGDHRAGGLIDSAAERAGAGLAVMVNLLDVERVVLGGPIWSRISERFLAVAPDVINARLVAAPGVQVTGSAVGEHVAAQGAAVLVLDHFLSPRPSALLME